MEVLSFYYIDRYKGGEEPDSKEQWNE